MKHTEREKRAANSDVAENTTSRIYNEFMLLSWLAIGFKKIPRFVIRRYSKKNLNNKGLHKFIQMSFKQNKTLKMQKKKIVVKTNVPKTQHITKRIAQ